VLAIKTITYYQFNQVDRTTEAKLKRT